MQAFPLVQDSSGTEEKHRSGQVSRTSSEATLVEAVREALTIKVGSVLPWDEKTSMATRVAHPPSRPALIWVCGFAVSSYVTTAIQSYLAIRDHSSADTNVTLLLPPIGFAFVAILTRIPQWLPSGIARTVLPERISWLSGRSSSTASIRHAVPVALCASLAATTLCLAARNMPGLLIQSLSIFVAPIVLSILPFLPLPSASQPITLLTIVISACIGFALNSFSTPLDSIPPALLRVLFTALLLVTMKLWSQVHSVTPGVILMTVSPIAAILSCIPAIIALPISDILHPHTLHFPAVSLYAIASATEQICLANIVNALELADIPLAFAPKAFLAILFAPEMITNASPTLVLCLAFGYATLAIAKEWLSPSTNASEEYIQLDRTESPTSPSSNGKQRFKPALLLSLLPLFLWVFRQTPIPGRFVFDARAIDALKPQKMEIVIAYYKEPISDVQQQIAYIRSLPEIMDQKPIFTMYAKASEEDVPTDWLYEHTGVDQVIRLDNFGREGGTYMRHIISRYNASSAPSTEPAEQTMSWPPWKHLLGQSAQHAPQPVLADHTMFLQAHLSWGWISKPRMKLFDQRTGYLAFGPYVAMECGRDMRGNGHYPRMAQVYSIFREELCPKEAQLGSYAAQFVVSRERILANPVHKYQMIDEIIEAGDDSWIHEEGTDFVYGKGDPTGSTNPFFGHALERSWPVIFNCIDAKMAEECDDKTFDKEKCQCFDPPKHLLF